MNQEIEPVRWALVSTNINYQVSNTGLVKHGALILKPYDDGHGYDRVSINRKDLKVHRLIAIAFLENPNNYKCVNHKDGNKKNNHVDNLEWCNHSQNRVHALKIGLVNEGHKRTDAKLSISQVLAIREEYNAGGISQRSLAVKYSIGKSAIQLVLTNKTYKNAI